MKEIFIDICAIALIYFVWHAVFAKDEVVKEKEVAVEVAPAVKSKLPVVEAKAGLDPDLVAPALLAQVAPPPVAAPPVAAPARVSFAPTPDPANYPWVEFFFVSFGYWSTSFILGMGIGALLSGNDGAMAAIIFGYLAWLLLYYLVFKLFFWTGANAFWNAIGEFVYRCMGW